MGLGVGLRSTEEVLYSFIIVFCPSLPTIYALHVDVYCAKETFKLISLRVYEFDRLKSENFIREKKKEKFGFKHYTVA